MVNGLPLPEKKRFLKFVTGSNRAPVGGLGNLKITVQREADSERLPTTHTCFNTLVLPEFGSRRARPASPLWRVLQHAVVLICLRHFLAPAQPLTPHVGHRASLRCAAVSGEERDELWRKTCQRVT